MPNVAEFISHRMLAWSAVIGFAFLTASGSRCVHAQDSADQNPASQEADSPGTPSSDAQAAKIARLIRELGDPEYDTRAEAQRQLAKLGPAAFDALAEAEAGSDAEVSRRATYLLRSIRIPWIRDDDPADVRQALRAYEALDADKRLLRINEFALMPSDIATGPLCRIVRYEQREILAKAAALLIIDRPPPEGKTLERQRTTIRQTLGTSKRAAARWLMAYEQFFVAPDKSMTAWDGLLTEETAALAAKSRDAHAGQIFRLRKRQYAMLLASGRKEDAKAAIAQMVLLQPAETQTLVEFIAWLTKEKAWDAIEDVAKRHAALFERDSTLVYSLANAQLIAGKMDEAEKTAAKALALDADDPEEHQLVANRLEKMGLFRWAEREYRYSIEHSPAGSLLALGSGLELAAMLQDQEQYLEAANARQAVVKTIGENAGLREQLELAEESYFSPKRLRAAMEFCFAMHHAKAGDRAKQIEHLDKAVDHYPFDADVLIALYRLPEQDEERRARTRKLISTAARTFQLEIDRREADSADPRYVYAVAVKHNEYAWLVSNTFGDYDLALKYAIKSNEVYETNEAGLLDTLGRCYFAKGDLENAIRIQTKANQLDPHSGAIARQLKLFQEEAAKLDAARKGEMPVVVPRATEPD
jgi:tetratricopeptide (TPR) repeat protein